MTHYRVQNDASFADDLPWSIYEVWGESMAFAACKATLEECVTLLDQLISTGHDIEYEVCHLAQPEVPTWV